VETLFLGGAAAIRRETLRPIADFMRGRDQRNVELLDVACGTGRLLREVRLNWPGMRLTGVDLSHPYLDEGRRHFGGLRPSTWIAAAAECLPLPGNSVRIATATYLFHELPADVRRKVTGEIVRVLRPGGLFVFLDSLQLGDRPDWDGVLENFPSRFHEPFYRQYLREDLAALFRDAGLQVESSWASYLSKVMVCRKPA